MTGRFDVERGAAQKKRRKKLLLLTAVMVFVVLLPMLMVKVKTNVMIAMVAMVILCSAAIGWMSDAVVMVMLLVIAGTLAMTGAKWLG
jgi:lipoprotein signal peptidase